MSSLGFIILRHVHTSDHNRLWQKCYRCIREHYPDNKIVIIDDASDKQHLTTELTLHNTEILQSEYPTHLLPIVHTRNDRMILERVFSVVTQLKHPLLPISAIERAIDKSTYLTRKITGRSCAFLKRAHTSGSAFSMFVYWILIVFHSAWLMCIKMLEDARSRTLIRRDASCVGSIHRQFLDLDDYWKRSPTKQYDKYPIFKVFSGR